MNYSAIKRILIPAAAAIASAAFLTGCNGQAPAPGAANAPEGGNAGTQATDPSQGAEPAQAGEASQGDKQDTSVASQDNGPAPSIHIDYPFRDRFLYGDKNLYYIEDDGSLTCEYRCREDETIDICDTDDKHCFFLVASPDASRTLYFLDEKRELSQTPLYMNDATYVSSAGCYDGMFYYSIYDSGLGRDVPNYYDPEGDGFLVDNSMDRLERFFSNYEGRGVTRAAYGAGFFRDLELTGRIIMNDDDNSKLLIFDNMGKELKSVDIYEDSGSFRYFGRRFVVGEGSEYNKDTFGVDRQYHVLYDTDKGESHVFLDRKGSGSLINVETIRGDYLYYTEDFDGEGHSFPTREFKRMKIEDILADKPESETILTLQRYPNVNDTYGSYYLTGIRDNAFTVKPDRLYYLDFDPEGKDGRKGDVVWRSLPLDSPAGADYQVTKVMERHESFADWGSVSVEYDRRKAPDDDSFTYFTGFYSDFRFYDDVKNAVKLNAEMEEIDRSLKKLGDEVADSARRDIIENTDEDSNIEWFKKYIGTGYSFDKNFEDVTGVGDHHVQVTYGDYEYYGGAHGMGSSCYYLFDLDSGERVEFTDLYKGTDEEFTKVALRYSMMDWKDDTEGKYYNEYDPSLEGEMEDSFKDCINTGMTISYDNYGINIHYSPYAVGPYASGEIAVHIPYYELGFEL